MTKEEESVAKQYTRWQEADAKARLLWEQVGREGRKLVRLAKVGRKASKIVPISAVRGVQIKNRFRGKDRVFAPAFARKWEFKEVPLDQG